MTTQRSQPGSENAGELDALREVEQQLRTVIESAPICLARVDQEGTILAMNTAARTMLKATGSSDVLRKPIVSFVEPDYQDAARQFIDETCRGKAGTVRLSMTGVSGPNRVIDLSGVALPPRGEIPGSALLSFRDVTAWTRLEQLLLKKEQVKGEDKPTSDPAQRQITAQQLERLKTEYKRRMTAMAAERDRRRAEAEEATAKAAEAAERAASGDELRRRLDESEANCRLALEQRDELRASVEVLQANERAQIQRLEALQAEIASAATARAEAEKRLHEAELSGQWLTRDAETVREMLELQLDDSERARAGAAAERDALRAELAKPRVQPEAREPVSERWIELHDELLRALALARSEFERLDQRERARHEPVPVANETVASVQPERVGRRSG